MNIPVAFGKRFGNLGVLFLKQNVRIIANSSDIFTIMGHTSTVGESFTEHNWQIDKQQRNGGEFFSRQWKFC